ncbi:MAG: DUF4263 domain-containing protein [Oscillospiraceae bacterium]|nr:DUF4263 domain-containing protein [Oscillospiraceae bacterium]
MGEIKVSKKGVEYAPAKVLKTKQRVYSQALLMKIPHDHAGLSDISLKLGRYTLPYGRVVGNQPKSELTLDNDELSALIKYISDNYTPVNLGQGQYISVDRDNAELIRQFKTLVDGQTDTANLLIENGILSDHVYVAATSIKKIAALEQYEASLAKDYPERYWQSWFSENKWLLGSDFAQIIDERRIDTENIADYIMRAFDGFVDLVEIKKPNGLPFWASSKDHDNYVPSSELIKAITQCLNYLRAIEEEANSVKFVQKTKSKVIKPRCILIYGRSDNWNDEQREAYRILNTAYNQLSILTYDHLLLRAKNVLGVIDNPVPIRDEDALPF